jgi:KipI family sensor histidine kinase inhibitor
VGGVPTRSVPVGEIRPLGDHALLMGVSDAVAARRLTRALAAARLEGVAEVVGGLATVMVAFDPMTGDVDAPRPLLAHLLEQVCAQPDEEADDEDGGVALLEIPCTFDGPDLAEVATLVGSTPEAVVALMTARPLTVAVVGFSPGFPYLAGLPAVLGQVPRRPRPRPSVPAGSVALANGHAGVYPSASPGGWQLIGHTDVPLFSPWEPPYARLAPGDHVRFVESAQTAGNDAGRSSTWRHGPGRLPEAPPPGSRAVFEVDEPGLRSVLQDGGRRGLAALGVPAASPADPDSFQLANELVGNAVGACTLEITARGPTLRCLSPTFVAVVGGSPDLRLQGQPLAAGRVVPVAAGQELVVGVVRDGFRCYVALAGGFVGPALFGSYASDQLAGLGPGPILPGTQLWGAAMEPPLGDHLRAGASRRVDQGRPVVLRVVPGPHPELFATGTFAALASMRFTVEAASNRVGLRLRRDPRTPALRAALGAPDELDSQGMVTGAVQVPPDGEPVILLTDHATLGGYPVVAVVATVDHGALGQCAPGTTVVLVPCDPDEADEALREHRRALGLAVSGHYPLAVE